MTISPARQVVNRAVFGENSPRAWILRAPLRPESLRFGEICPLRASAGRAGSSAAVITKINRQLASAIKMPDVEEKLRQLGSDGIGDTPEHFGVFVRAEPEKYARLIKKAGIKVE